VRRAFEPTGSPARESVKHGVVKAIPISSHPDRNAQFEYVNAEVLAAQAAGQPVICVDTN
jgi:Rhodopirellula transposase DDE domain